VLQTPRADDPLADLTNRERNVLSLVAEGHTNNAIAERLILARLATPGDLQPGLQMRPRHREALQRISKSWCPIRVHVSPSQALDDHRMPASQRSKPVIAVDLQALRGGFVEAHVVIPRGPRGGFVGTASWA
jgi:hypothetical protein